MNLDATLALKAYSEDEERDSHGRWTKGGDAYQFYSPNIEENLTFQQASQRLKSDDQARYMAIGLDVDKQIGFSTTPHNAIGDWSDGAENTIFNEIHNDGNFKDVEYSAAVKGLIGNQKAVIPFTVNPNGNDSLYRFTMQGSPNIIRKTLDQEGINFRTLVPGKSGNMEVVVFDPGTEIKNTIGKLAEKHDLQVKQYRGQGEFLGGSTRVEGKKEYQKVIKSYESSHSRRYQR